MMHDRKWRIIAVMTFVAAVASAVPSHQVDSQIARTPLCSQRPNVVDGLRAEFGERLVGQGVSSAGVIIEVFAATTGSWTILATNAAGVSCLVSAGEAWEAVKVTVPATAM